MGPSLLKITPLFLVVSLFIFYSTSTILDNDKDTIRKRGAKYY